MCVCVREREREIRKRIRNFRLDGGQASALTIVVLMVVKSNHSCASDSMIWGSDLPTPVQTFCAGKRRGIM